MLYDLCSSASGVLVLCVPNLLYDLSSEISEGNDDMPWSPQPRRLREGLNLRDQKERIVMTVKAKTLAVQFMMVQ